MIPIIVDLVVINVTLATNVLVELACVVEVVHPVRFAAMVQHDLDVYLPPRIVLAQDLVEQAQVQELEQELIQERVLVGESFVLLFRIYIRYVVCMIAWILIPVVLVNIVGRFPYIPVE